MNTQDFFSFDIICLAVTLLSALYIPARILPRCRKINDKSKSDGESLSESSQEMPPVSVIVYSAAWCEQLNPLIKSIFAQDYPTEFEVIVVNAEKDSRTEDEISELQLTYRNLYLTFSPGKPKNLSPKKLALTIGIKAAKHENLILTHSNVTLPSDQWLKSMARHFTDGNELVIGFGRLDPETEERLGSMQTYDFALESMRWLGHALSGRATRASGFNLGYRKSLFFKNRGFSDSLNLMYGDDDIFVEKIASQVPYTVELSQQSIVNVEDSEPKRYYNRVRTARHFTSDFIPRRAFAFTSSISISAWLWLISSVLAVVFCQTRFYVPIAVGCIFLGLWLPLIFGLKSFLKTIYRPKTLYALPLLTLFRPFYTCKLRRKIRKNKQSHYAWGVFKPF